MEPNPASAETKSSVISATNVVTGDSPSKKGIPNMVVVLVAIFSILIAAAGTFFVLNMTGSKSSSTVTETEPVEISTPSTKPKDASASADKEEEFQAIDSSMKKLDADMASVDAGLSDKEPDLSQ